MYPPLHHLSFVGTNKAHIGSTTELKARKTNKTPHHYKMPAPLQHPSLYSHRTTIKINQETT
jgi:hypothetical protein